MDQKIYDFSSKKIKVLHMNSARGWRGGENQLNYLFKNKEQAPEIRHYLFCRSENLKNFDLEANATRPFTFLLFDLFRIFFFCKQKKIDIIHVHSSKVHTHAWILKSFFIPKVKIFIHRRINFKIKKNWFTKKKYLSQLNDQFICVSHAIAKNLLSYGVDKEKILTIHSGVPKAPFLGGNLEKHDQAHKVIFSHVGVLDWTKGHKILIQSLALLNEKFKDFHCYIAGSGPLRKDLESFVKKLELESKVSFLGQISNVPDLLAKTHILSFPTRKEGLGTTVIESMLSGCAVAGSNEGGIPEMIIHGQTGILFDPENIQEISEGLYALAADRRLRKKLAKAGRELAEREFLDSTMSRRVFSSYREIF